MGRSTVWGKVRSSRPWRGRGRCSAARKSASAGRFSSDPQRVYERWFEFVEWAEKTPSGEPVPIDRQQLGPRVSGTVHGGDTYFRAAMPDVYAANVCDIPRFRQPATAAIVNITVSDIEIQRPDGLTSVNAVANLSNP